MGDHFYTLPNNLLTAPTVINGVALSGSDYFDINASQGGANVFSVAPNAPGVTQVNGFRFFSGASGAQPLIATTGGDANVGIGFQTRNASANFQAAQLSSAGQWNIAGNFVMQGANAIIDTNSATSLSIGQAQANALNLGNSTSLINLAFPTTALGGGAAPTLGTIGGSGPATAAQNSWLGVKIGGTLSFIPVWR